MIATYALLTTAVALAGSLDPETAGATRRLPGVVTMTRQQPLEILHRRTIERRLDEAGTLRGTHGLLPTPYATMVNFTLYDVTVEDRDDIQVSMSIGENQGISMTITAPMVRLRGRIGLAELGPLWVRKQGDTNFTAVLSDVQMTMQRTVTTTDRNRKLLWASSNVTAAVGAVDLRLDDLDLDRWQGQIADLDKKRFVVECLTDPSFYENLTTIKTHSFHVDNITEGLRLNKTIVRPPTVGDKVVTVEYGGDVLFDGDEANETVGGPTQWDRLALNNHQAIRISKFTFETLGNMVHRHQILSSNYTKADLPKESAHILDMNCSGVCFGSLLPNASRSHPLATAASMTVKSASAPVFNITQDALSCLYQFIVTVSAVNNKDSTIDHLFTARLSLNIVMELRVENDHLLFKHLRSNSSFGVDNSSIGAIPDDVLRSVTSLAMYKIMMPALNWMGTEGMDIRLFDYTTVSKYKFVLKEEKSVDLLMDVVYKRNETETETDVVS